MAGLWYKNPDTPGGKFLVVRRDGTVPEWPHFVLGGGDPASPWALRAYAVAAFLCRMDWQYVRDVWGRAGEFVRYRRDHGNGDPDAGRHRVDDPETVARMRAARGS